MKESNEGLILEKVNLEKELHSTKDNMERLQRTNLENLGKKEKEYETCE